MSNQEASKIGRYLLGELPREETDTLERRLLTESGLFELAESVEDEIVDRYVRGEMAAEEARRFERRLLPSERIRERVAFARALAAQGAERARQDGRSATVVPLFRTPARLAWAATLVALLAAGALALEVARLRDRASELDRARSVAVAQLQEAGAERATPPAAARRPERAEQVGRLEAELAASRARVAELEAEAAATTERRVRRPRELGDQVASASVFLSLATRGDQPETLELQGAERAELQLDLGGARPEAPLTATVLREGQPVWRQPRVPVETADGESMARLVMPSQALLAGRYRVELAEGETGDTRHLVGTYDLLVVP